MPHQCTNCGRGFEDGSQEMLSGCPNCGGNKFQFRPEGADPPSTDAEPPEPPEPPGGNSTVAKTVGKTAATVRDFVGGNDEPSVGAPDAAESTASADDAEIAAGSADGEDAAQASARGDVVSPDELPSEPQGDEQHQFQPVESETTDAEESADDTDERPDLKELREELNNQFESIKVVQPGQYELNLMELYDREEYIVALEEDGRYSIQVPEAIK
jgi:predicted  nucleic acid-binding Zn-ribbon protein